MTTKQNPGRQRRRSSAEGQKRLLSLFARIFVFFFCATVLSNFVLLSGKRERLELEALVTNAFQRVKSSSDAYRSSSHDEMIMESNATDAGNDGSPKDMISKSVSLEIERNNNGSGEEPQSTSAFLTMYGEHRVQHAIASLPKWLQDYFAWHRHETENNSANTKYLVVSCVGNDKCGGFSDRLRSLPFFLFVASRVDRVLCIYWSRPFGLDQFLKPLKNGIDWRCPADFEPLVNKTIASRWQTKYRHHILYYSKKRYSGLDVAKEAITTIRSHADRFYSIGFKHQDFAKIDATNMVFHAHSYKDRMPLANAWIHVPLMEHIFRAMFEPIEPIAKSINDTMTRLGLVENEYTSVHVRAKYPTNELASIIGDDTSIHHDLGASHVEFSGPYKNYVVRLGRNALECGMLLKPNHKIFFSSDSTDLTKYFTDNPITPEEENEEYKVVGINSRDEIRHLEQSRHDGQFDLNHVEYYPLIEDLLIMGGSQCVAHGVGSYGAFGAGLAGNRCRAIHRAPNGKIASCPNDRGDNRVVNITESDLILDEKTSEYAEGLLPPAQEQKMEIVVEGEGAVTNEVKYDDTEGSPFLTMYGEHRVQSSLAALPRWLKDYFAWHRGQTMNAGAKTKYLALTCLNRDKCGGFSDRLRALPFWLLLASKVDRVLCIYWSRPFGLDWFLQPLPSGINWRCPDEFINDTIDPTFPSKYQKNFPHIVLFNRKPSPPVNVVTKTAIRHIRMMKDKYVSASFKDQGFEKINAANMVFHASSYLDPIPVVGSWMHVPLMEHIFRVMFEPIEPIARRINATMSQLGLVENQYTSVHVRARYPTMKMARIMGKLESRDHDKNEKKLSFDGNYKQYLLEIAHNALECAILLEPQNKLFFSSDSTDLTKYIMNHTISITRNDFDTTLPHNATYNIVGIDSRNEIKHLEHGRHTSHIEFYPLIEDLLIMGGSRCVSHGIGSFGAFGAGLAGNRCRAVHRSPMGPTSHCPNNRSYSFITQDIGEFLLGDEGEGRLPPAVFSTSSFHHYEPK